MLDRGTGLGRFIRFRFRSDGVGGDGREVVAGEDGGGEAGVGGVGGEDSRDSVARSVRSLWMGTSRIDWWDVNVGGLDTGFWGSIRDGMVGAGAVVVN